MLVAYISGRRRVRDGEGAGARGELERADEQEHDPVEVQALLRSLRIALSIVQSRARAEDEAEGHPFRGNQYVQVASHLAPEPEGDKPTKATAKGVKMGVHELLSSGHPFTMAELQAATGATTLKQISDALAMLKNPKWAGSKGTLTIVKEGDMFRVKRNDPGVHEPPPVAPPAPPPVAAAPPAPPKVDPEAERRQKYHEQSIAAYKASELAERHTVGDDPMRGEMNHLAAAQAQEAAAELAGDAHTKEYHRAKASMHRNRATLIRMRAAEIFKQNQPAPGTTARDKEIQARFKTKTPAQVQEHFKSKYGLNFTNGADTKAYEQAKKELNRTYHTMSLEQRQRERDRIQAMADKLRAVPGMHVRTHTHHDITAGGAAAAGQRKMLGYVDDAMEQLNRDYDIKAALDKANVHYAAGSTGRSLGHAWQDRTAGTAGGYFSVGHGKSINLADQVKAAEYRKAAGKNVFTVGAHEGDGGRRATIVHELTHAFGMQPHIASPQKLQAKLNAMFPDWQERVAFIKKNISEYAATNIKETDAELAALVTSPDYKRGTLPSVLEEHVDELFHRRK